jgi:hypothetical protein
VYICQPVARDNTLTRRKLLGGVTAAVGVSLYSPPARALGPVMEAIEALVLLWEGYKMAKEIYEEFFAHGTEPVIGEVVRVYGPQNFIVNNYYSFGNSYRVAALNAAEPGCQVAPRFSLNARSLCCSARRRPVFLSAGCIVGLHAAEQQLRTSLRADNVFAYTRPIEYVTPVEPWHQIDPFGNQLISDLRYHSVSGSVALRWQITNRSARTCRSEFKIRDDTSLRVVAEGVTGEFYF